MHDIAEGIRIDGTLLHDSIRRTVACVNPASLSMFSQRTDEPRWSLGLCTANMTVL